MSYGIDYSSEAERALEKLDKAVKIQILKKIEHLQENPELGEPLSNVLKGKWRLHIGKWRIIYTVSENCVTIAKIGHRKGVYE